MTKTPAPAELLALFALRLVDAGEDFSWPVGQGRPQGGTGALLRWFLAAQGGICAACGEPAEDGDVWNLCHLISSGPKRRGYGLPGVLYAGHLTCNDADSNVFGAIVHPDTLVRPDIVPTTYPTAADLKVHAVTSRDEAYARRLAARQGA